MMRRETDSSISLVPAPSGPGFLGVDGSGGGRGLLSRGGEAGNVPLAEFVSLAVMRSAELGIFSVSGASAAVLQRFLLI